MKWCSGQFMNSEYRCGGRLNHVNNHKRTVVVVVVVVQECEEEVGISLSAELVEVPGLEAPHFLERRWRVLASMDGSLSGGSSAASNAHGRAEEAGYGHTTFLPAAPPNHLWEGGIPQLYRCILP
jgi:hypothetical protein